MQRALGPPGEKSREVRVTFHLRREFAENLQVQTLLSGGAQVWKHLEVLVAGCTDHVDSHRAIIGEVGRLLGSEVKDLD